MFGSFQRIIHFSGDVPQLVADINTVNHAVLTSSPSAAAATFFSLLTPEFIQKLSELFYHENQHNSLAQALGKLLFNVVDFFPSCASDVVKYAMEVVLSKLEFKRWGPCALAAELYLGIVQVVVKSDLSGELCRRIVDLGGIKAILSPVPVLDPKDAAKALSIAASLVKRAQISRTELFEAILESIGIVRELVLAPSGTYERSKAIHLICMIVLQLSRDPVEKKDLQPIRAYFNHILSNELVKRLVQCLLGSSGGQEILLIKVVIRLSKYSPALHKVIIRSGIVAIFKNAKKKEEDLDREAHILTLGKILGERSSKKIGPHLIPMLCDSIEMSGSQTSEKLNTLLWVTKKSTATVVKPFITQYARIVTRTIEQGQHAETAMDIYTTLTPFSRFKFVEKVQRQGLVGSLERLVERLQLESPMSSASVIARARGIIESLSSSESSSPTYSRLVCLAEQIRELSRSQIETGNARALQAHLQALNGLATELSKSENITDFEFGESGIQNSIVYYLTREDSSEFHTTKELSLAKWNLTQRQQIFAHVFFGLPLPESLLPPPPPLSSRIGKPPPKRPRSVKTVHAPPAKKPRFRATSVAAAKKKPPPSGAKKNRDLALKRLIQLLHDRLNVDMFPNTQIRYSEDLDEPWQAGSSRQRWQNHMASALQLITDGSLRVQLNYESSNPPRIPSRAKPHPLKVYGPGALKIQNLIAILLNQNPQLKETACPNTRMKNLLNKRREEAQAAAAAATVLAELADPPKPGQKRKANPNRAGRPKTKRRKTNWKESVAVKQDLDEAEQEELRIGREVQNGVHMVGSMDGVELDPGMSVLEALLRIKFPHILNSTLPIPLGTPARVFSDVFKNDVTCSLKFQFKEKPEHSRQGWFDEEPSESAKAPFQYSVPAPSGKRRHVGSVDDGNYDFDDSLDYVSVRPPGIVPKLSRHAHRTRYQLKQAEESKGQPKKERRWSPVPWKTDPDTQRNLLILRVLHAMSEKSSLLYGKAPDPQQKPLLPPEIFINKALVRRFYEQIQDQVVVFTNSIARWCREFIPEYTFMFPYDQRLLLFRLLGFGHERGIKTLERHMKDGSLSIPTGLTSVLSTERTKFVQVRRDSLLHDSMTTFRALPHLRDFTLKVRFQGEDGVGSGPTMEFFTLLGHELRRKDLGLWLDDESFRIKSAEQCRLSNTPRYSIAMLRCESCHLVEFARCPEHQRLFQPPEGRSDLTGLFLSGVGCTLKRCNKNSCHLPLKCAACNGQQSIEIINPEKETLTQLKLNYPANTMFLPVVILLCRTCRAVHFPKKYSRPGGGGSAYLLSNGMGGDGAGGPLRATFRHVCNDCPAKQIFRQYALLSKHEVDALVQLSPSLKPLTSKTASHFIAKRPAKDPDLQLVDQFKLFPRAVSRWRNIFPFASELDYFRFLGKIMAQALFERKRIDLPLADIFFQVLMGKPVATRHLVAVHPNRHFVKLFKDCYDVCRKRERILLDKSLRGVRNMPKKEFVLQNNGCSVADLGLTMATPDGLPLCPNGEKINVKLENLRCYINGMIKFVLLDGTRHQFEAVREGFREVCSWSLKELPLTPQELSILIQGSGVEEELDFSPENLVKHVQTRKSVDGTPPTLPRSISMLFEVLHSFSKTEQRAFIQFVTGSPSLPAGGLAALRPPIAIVQTPTTPHADPHRLEQRYPGASTCHHILRLPNYRSKDNLREKLLTAMNNSRFDLS